MITKIFKLTTANGTTYADHEWTPGQWYGPLSGEGPLCDSGWYHSYASPELAVLLNPIHEDYKNPILWVGEGRGKCLDDSGLKQGHTEMMLIEQMELPKYTLEQKAAFGILCALEIYKEPEFVAWAGDWLAGKDWTARAAVRAARSASAVWKAAMTPAEYTAAAAAAQSAYAARRAMAARVARVARSAYAARAYAASSAYAASTAVSATRAARLARATPLDLVRLAEMAKNP